jgi:RHS repeat-associated protein
MRYIIILFLILSIIQLFGQTTYTSNPIIGEYVNCPANNDCGNGIFLGNTIKMKTSSISGNNVVFTITKCYGGTFDQGGIINLKEDDECSNAVTWENYSSGETEISISYTFPSAFTSGSKRYYIVIESENPNGTYTKYRAGYVTIYASTPQCPDLQVASTYVTSTAAQGETITFRCRILNEGDATAGSSKTRYYISTNTTLGSSDTYIGYSNVSGIAAGGMSGLFYKDFDIPSNFTPGGYYLLFVADADEDVDECCSGCEYNTTFEYFIITEACPDPYEPNNDSDDATTNVFSTLSNGNYDAIISDANIHEDDDADYYKIYYNSDGQVTVNLTSLPANYELELWNSSESATLGTSTNTGNSSESVSVSLQGSGFFYIKVYSHNNSYSDCNTYYLNVDWCPEADHNSFDATNITHYSFDAFWDEVNGADGYNIKVRELSDPDYSNPVFEGSTNTNSITVTGLNPVTTYKYQIQTDCNSINSTWSSSSSSSFTTLDDSCPDPYEPNNDSDNATISAFSTLSNGNYDSTITDANIHEDDDADYYKINYNSDGQVTVNLTSLPANYELELWNSSESATLGTSTNTGNSSESVSVSLQGSGFFYIKVYSHNNSYSDCNTYYLNVDWCPEADHNSFDATNITHYSFDAFWDEVNGADGYNIKVRELSDPDYSNPVFDGSTNTNSITVTGLDPVTTYKYQIQTDCNSINSTWSSSSSSGFTTLSSTNCADTYETNETKATATTGAFSTLGNGNYNATITDANIHQNGDVDFFKINYIENGTVTVELTNLAANYELELWNEVESLVYSVNTGNLDESVTYGFSGSGHFYIKIYGNGGTNSSCTNYVLTLDWIADTPADCTYFSDLPSTEINAYNAAVCLCNLGYITPQDHNGDGNEDELNANEIIYRADLAKMVFFALYEGDNPAYSDPFPVPFIDLQQYYIPYYRYAKALSYLEYDDGIPPFTRDYLNFRPYDGISKKYVLKVMLEAFDISPDNSGPSPFPGEINPGDDAYGYVKEAHDRGYITNGNVHDLMIRKYAFVILHRILSDQANEGCAADCDQTCHPTISDSDYFLPGNFTPTNLNRSIGMDEGFFHYTSPTGFYIPGINLPLAFNHSYKQHIVELPYSYTQFKKVNSGNNPTIVPLRPLGKGWTHTYNSYLIKIPGWNAQGYQVPQKIMVFWPGGNIHFYNDATKQAESMGVYDDMIEVSSTVIRIKMKNQTEFTFTRYSNDTDHPYYLTQIKDRNNNTVTITYEAKNDGHRIKKVTGTAGRILWFYYQSGTNYLSHVKDATGNRDIYFTVDAINDNLSNSTNPRGKLTTYDYGSKPSDHLLISITRPEGNIITNNYYDNKKLHWTKLASGGQSIQNTFTQTPNFGSTNSFLQTTTTDQQDTETISDYNDDGLIKKISIDDADIIYTYGTGNDTAHIANIDYEGFDTDIDYDSKGNITRITLPMGVVHEYDYNSLNDIIWYEDPKNNRTSFYYDSNDNLDYIEDNMNFITDLTINNKGQVIQLVNPENIVTAFTYDNYGNRTDVNAPLGIHSHSDFDEIGRITSLENPLDQITSFMYDAHNQIKKVTQQVSTGNVVTDYNYDDNDNLLWIQNALGHKTTMTYDDRDFVETVTFGNDTKTYTYRNDGLLDTYQKPGGSGIFNYDYDDLGRVTTDGFTTYTYWDEKDLVKTVTKDNNTLTFYYDDLDRIDYYTDYYNKTVDYDYDVNSNITKITYPGGFYVEYIYDDNNRLTDVKWDNGNKTTTYIYHDDGRLEKSTNPNGTYTEYSYDAAGRMTGLSNKKGDGTIISSYTFELDALGNHLEEDVIEPYGAPTLTDLNLTNTYNSENEITSSGSTSFSFDANGNRTLKAGTSSTWNIYDMMTGIGSNSYEYDGMGLRRKAIHNGSTTKYVWDIQGMGNILLEMNNSGTPQHYYIHGLGLIARKEVSSNNIHYYHYDFRGSTIAMTDESENITHQYKYSPFGSITDKSEADSNPFTYVGKYGVMNEGDDIFYMRARYTDALTGRFLSEDPEWHANLYPYSRNNPINTIDPLGKFSIDPIFKKEMNNLIYSGECTAFKTLEAIPFVGKFMVHFNEGSGETYYLSESDMNKIRWYYYLGNYKYSNESNKFYGENGEVYYEVKVNFHKILSPLLFGAFGNATVIVDDNNKPVGFRDTYDYESYNQDKWLAKKLNQIGEVGYKCGSRTYKIRYGIVFE